MSVKMQDLEFNKLLKSCVEISENHPNDIVYIGGIAIFLHTYNDELTKKYSEFTHDADFYISITGKTALRDIEEVVPNKRLGK